MVSDSIPSSATAAASSNPRDFAKKKRANRSAKLKQCKLDARREQWLSQVKINGGHKQDGGRTGEGMMSLEHERGMPIEKLEIKPSVEVGFYGGDRSMHHDSDSDSLLSASPTSQGSSLSGSNDYIMVNFTESSSSSSSNGCFSGSMSEEDEEGLVSDDGCLDDWEVLADALVATEDEKEEHSPYSVSDVKSTHYGPKLSITNQPSSGNDISNSKQVCGGNTEHCHAWKADDAFRPQSLPNLSKTYFVHGGSAWGHTPVLPVPAPCPICFEDLDCTDSSFVPCLCGFRLCLFCHKRILEEDGRCPGCRKQYSCNLLEGRQYWMEEA